MAERIEINFPRARYACDILHEIRDLDRTRNYGVLPGLIEELQTVFNRMEAGLTDIRRFNNIKEEYEELSEAVKRLKKEKKALSGDTDEDDEFTEWAEDEF